MSSTRSSKNDSDRAITLVAEAVHVPGHLAAPGSPKAKQLIHAQAHSCSTLTGAGLPQAKKVLCLCIQGHFGRVQLSATLWTVACQASLPERGLSRQEYWSVLANTGCHTLLEHCISCYPTHHPLLGT